MTFDPIARFYDLDDGRLSEDIPLYLGFAAKTGSPLLDLGIGSARLALPLARAGFTVTGIDISAPMLALARERIMRAGLDAAIRLVHTDFTAPELDADGDFGLAYCGYNAFLHLIETDAQLRALRAWRALLRPGGLLVIDVENPQLEALASLSGELLHEETLVDGATGDEIEKYTAAWVDLTDQILYLQREYHWQEQAYRTSFQVRILFQRELALLLHCAGYDNLRFYGDYQLNPWHPESPRLIAVAERLAQNPISE